MIYNCSGEYKKKLNNKGLSLVELLVAIAVGSIVLLSVAMLVTQGVSSYRKQTVLAQLQSDADITLNQISDNVMEADRLVIHKEADGSTSYIRLKEDVYYIYRNNAIYQSTDGGMEGGSMLCENVTEFDVNVLETSVKLDEETNLVESISSHVQVRIDIKLENMGEERKTDRKVSIRNNIADIAYVEKEMNRSFVGMNINQLSAYITENN